jgi:hypothetical protein
MTREQKISAAMQKRWQNPKFRKRMIRKQKKIGYRTYPV